MSFLDPNDELCAQIREFYLALTTEWHVLPTRELERHERIGLFLLAGAALVELSFTGQAWTDDSAVEFEATATGAWMDFDRTSMLPEGVRKVVPNWKGRSVMAQIGEELKVRLSTFGQGNYESVRETPNLPPMVDSRKRLVQGAMFLQYIALHRVVGRVGVRILSSRATAPGVVAQDTTTFNETLLSMIRDMLQQQRSMANSVDTLVSMSAGLSSQLQSSATECPKSNLKHHVVLAHQSFQRAVLHDGGPPASPLRGVWEWLKEYDPDPDYQLPDFEAWSRYLREYHQATGTGRGGSPRGGRKGRSMVTPDEIDPPRTAKAD